MSEVNLGLDRSGNNNHFTVNNMTLAADQMVDSPTNNFAVLNSEDTNIINGTMVFQDGNLKVLGNDGGTGRGVSTMGVNSGKWYAEVTIDTTHKQRIGIIDAVGLNLNADNGNDGVDYEAQAGQGIIYTYLNGSNNDTGTGSTSSGVDVDNATTGDIIGIALDADNEDVRFYLNNTALGSEVTDLQRQGVGSTYFFNIRDGSGSGDDELSCTINFGQDSSFAGGRVAQGNTDGNGIGDFFYAPPSGFLALCTANLPDADIIPTDYFSSVKYDGDAQDDRTVTGVGFSPGFVWSKAFTTTYNHFMVDTVRGVNAYVNSNRTNAESSDTDILKSFDADGYTLGNSGNMNESNHSHVAWNWYLGGTGAANTEGSLNTTKTQASTASGFSIVTYTGNATSGATLGHGLTKAPEWFMTKKRGASGGWMVYHIGNTAAPETDELNLEVTEATQDSDNIWDDTAPTATVFSLGNNAAVNANNVTFVAFLWHSVEGYSRFGKYTGNGNADGPFVYLGFKPAFVLTKRTDDADNWRLTDNARDPFNNAAIGGLKANATDSEADTGNRNFDYLSNGFKVRETDVDMNADGGNYIYMAFAEIPFKYSNAR
jgi:hypothetical protein